jgi:hypothetical protein
MSVQKASSLLSPSDSLPATRVSGEGQGTGSDCSDDSGKPAVGTGEAVYAASPSRYEPTGLCAEPVPGLLPRCFLWTGPHLCLNGTHGPKGTKNQGPHAAFRIHVERQHPEPWDRAKAKSQLMLRSVSKPLCLIPMLSDYDGLELTFLQPALHPCMDSSVPL